MWEKSASSVEYKYTVVNTAYNAYTGASNNGNTAYIPYGDGFTVNSSNEFVLTNRQELVFSYNGYNQTKLNILAGKYFFTGTSTSGIQSNVNITKCPIDSTVILDYGSFRMTNCEVYSKGKAVTLKTVYGYVNSPDPTAYPSAVSDGYTYTALGQLGNKVQIETGSYIGTGTNGKGNKNVISLPFFPKLVIVGKEDYGLASMIYGKNGAWLDSFLWYEGLNETRTYQSSSSNLAYTYFTNTSRTFTWYSNGDAQSQCNASGTTYYYIAIG